MRECCEACQGNGIIYKDLKKGEHISVRQHHSKPNEGLSYNAFTGVLLDDAESSPGWDVVDVMNDDGTAQSIYSFSIERNSDPCKYCKGVGWFEDDDRHYRRILKVLEKKQ